jgi:hypothetical protein
MAGDAVGDHKINRDSRIDIQITFLNSASWSMFFGQPYLIPETTPNNRGWERRSALDCWAIQKCKLFPVDICRSALP